MSELEDVIKELPPDLHQEVADFAKFLMDKRGRKPKGRSCTSINTFKVLQPEEQEDLGVSDEDELSITTRCVDDRSWGQVPEFEV